METRAIAGLWSRQALKAINVLGTASNKYNTNMSNQFTTNSPFTRFIAKIEIISSYSTSFIALKAK